METIAVNGANKRTREALIRDIKYIQETLKIFNREGKNLVMKLW